MIDAQGVIIAIDGEFALVRMHEVGCGRCNEEGGCGGNNIGKMFCHAPRTFRVLNPDNSLVGDQVSIVIAQGVVRRSAILAYVLPLLALFVGALCGLVSAVDGEAGAIIGAIGGLLLAWLALVCYQRISGQSARFQPYIKR